MRDILLNVRTDQETKQLLKDAASMMGTTVTGFILSTAKKEAHQLFNSKTKFYLNDEGVRYDLKIVPEQVALKH